MALKLNLLLLVVLVACIQNCAFSQKAFCTVIQFPRSLDTKKVLIEYDDGIQLQEVHDSIINKNITIHGKSFSKFITLDILYLNGKGQSLFDNTYFLNYGNSSIKFTGSLIDLQKSTFGSSTLMNATAVQNSSAQKKEQEFVKDEENELTDFNKKYDVELSNNNDSLRSIQWRMILNVLKKRLEFVKLNGNLYYSIWSFKFSLLPILIRTNPLLLKRTYATAFTTTFKKSREGREIEKLVNPYQILKKGDAAPGFEVKDITNKTIDLKSYKNKYVLIQFWATWCPPCMAELPMIKKIRDTYSKNDLEIIGISLDRDYKTYKAAIKSNDLNWTHLYHQIDIEREYGAQIIPIIYLIDKNGRIIIDKSDYSDTLLSLLKERLGKK